MAWLSVDKDGTEVIQEIEPVRIRDYWACGGERIGLPKGSIKKLIDMDLTWDDEALELKD